MWVRLEPPQGLDFPQGVDLLDRFEMVPHALDRMVIPPLDVLRLEHFGERPFPFLRDQTVLSHGGLEDGKE